MESMCSGKETPAMSWLLGYSLTVCVLIRSFACEKKAPLTEIELKLYFILLFGTSQNPDVALSDCRLE